MLPPQVRKSISNLKRGCLSCTTASHPHRSFCLFKISSHTNTGVPEPRDDHATVMARFANFSRAKMAVIVRQLEVLLGPDTGDLAMRYGLRSGAVTSGILRGKNSRFQLFGDTVNTAARMESTGEVNRVHMSQATADSLAKDRNAEWAERRTETVNAKGKGPGRFVERRVRGRRR